MSDTKLCYLSAAEVLARYKSRSLSPVELMDAVIARAQAVEPAINAFPMTYFDAARDAAKRAEAKYMKPGARLRKLEGLPVAIKDETPIKGKSTPNGSLLYKGIVDEITHPAPERILRAGGIVHARTATPEFSCAGFAYSKLWGVTRNPWNLDFTPGGSSGGAGAALAAGSTMLANGTDIGGSIRIPASASGVVGYKPPFGRNPDLAPYNLDWYCHSGPLARTVADCALLQNVMTGPHPKDIVSLRPKLRIPPMLKDIKGWKIAYSLDLGVYAVDPEVRANTLAAVDAFRELGCSVEQVDLGWSRDLLTRVYDHFGAIMGADSLRSLSPDDERLCAYTREFLRRAATTTPADLVESMELEGRMYETLGPILQTYRLLLCPTLAVPSVGAEHDVSDPDFAIDGVKVDAYLDWAMTPPFNMLARCPVLCVPLGRASNGVPTGLQIVGRTYDDVSVFRAGSAFERLNPWYASAKYRPPL